MFEWYSGKSGLVQDRSSHDRSSQDRSSQDRSSQDRSSLVGSRQDRSSHRSSHDRSSQDWAIKDRSSWGNARVKLHSQVHFKSKKILGPKSVGSKKVLIPKKFYVLS